MDKPVAVVTGGTGGIGSAICKRLARDNCVIACYFKSGNHEEARAWQKLQREEGLDIDILYADIRQFEDCQKLAEEVQARYGRVDILVNNAGVTADAQLKKMTGLQWHQVIDANLTSVFNVTRHFLPIMLERNYGRIVTISSINGRKGQFGQCNYAASKAALFGFTKSLALEVARHGITVNSVAPGYIETHMTEHMKPEVLQNIIADIPLGRLGKPDEIAALVAFIASPMMAFMTGATIDINGGQYM